MSATDSTFAGSVPEFYDRYLVPLHFEPYAEILAARIADLTSGDVLELAAGTGVVTRALRRKLPAQVMIMATDLNQPMLDYARSQPGAESVHWRQADALALPLPDGSFDAVVCQFGVMFFQDKVMAFREALRVLRPGGRFLFSMWDGIEHNAIMQITERVIASLFAPDPPQNMVAPFSYHDPAVIRADLQTAGFIDATIETLPGQSRAASAHVAAIAACQGGVLRNEIDARGPGRLVAATNAVAAALKDRFGLGEITAPAQAVLVTTRRPQE